MRNATHMSLYVYAESVCICLVCVTRRILTCDMVFLTRRIQTCVETDVVRHRLSIYIEAHMRGIAHSYT